MQRCLIAAGAAGPNASGDPYAPLRLYEGAWEVHVTTPAKKTDKIVNHCAKTGTFFSCEQEVNGKTTALMVFLPAGKATSGAQEYRMQALQPDASAPQDWSQLVIDGDTWLYSWDWMYLCEPHRFAFWMEMARLYGKGKQKANQLN